MELNQYSRRRFLKASSLLATVCGTLAFDHFPDEDSKKLPGEKDPDDLEKIKEIIKGKPVKWVFAGDSITQGAHHTYGLQGYPEIFAERMRWEMRRSWDLVINSGINGTNTSSLMHDFDWCIAQFKPAVVSLMYGTNDCQASEITTAVFEKNLTDLTGRIRDLGSIPVLQTPNGIENKKAVAMGIRSRERLGEYAAVIRAVASRHQLILVDNWAHWNAVPDDGYDAWLDDPLHPNASGHLEIARLLFKKLSIFDPESFTCSGKK